MPLGEQVALDPLEPAEQLVHQAADLGEVAADGEHLRAEPVLDGVADPARERRLELGGRRRESLDLLAGPLERRVELCGLDPTGGGLVDPFLCPLDRLGIHWRPILLAPIGQTRDGTVAARWTWPSWTMSCRPS